MKPPLRSETTREFTLRSELEREHERLRLMQEISLVLGSTLDLDAILQLVVERVSRLLDADRVTLYLIDDRTQELWSKVAQGAQLLEIRLQSGEGIAGWCARHGRTLNIKDVYKDPRFDGTWDRRTGYRTRSAICVPLKNHYGRTIGVLQALNKTDGYFSPDDESLLQALASQAAVSVENSKLFLSVVAKNMELVEAQERLEEKVRELDVLFEIAQVSASAPNLDDLLEGMLARAVRAVEAEAGSILLSDATTGDLLFRATVGAMPEHARMQRIAAGTCISGWVARHGEIQIVNQVDQDPRFARNVADAIGYHPRSLLCLPLRWNGGTGALELLNKESGRDGFDEDDAKFANVIAGHIANAIELSQERERQARGDRLSAIGRLLSSVLHDLRTPMTVIGNYVPAMVQEVDEGTRRSHAERVARQVRFVDAMTKEVLAFAKGERTALISKVYLQPFFNDLVEQLRGVFQEKGVLFELDLQDRGVAYFDPQKIERATFNLARNAVEAFAGNPGRFSIRVARADDGAIVMSFEDDGPGIPDQIRNRLFESFATHGKAGGTGLGLAIVERIVADHGGSVSVVSRPGQTVFTVTLAQENVAMQK